MVLVYFEHIPNTYIHVSSPGCEGISDALCGERKTAVSSSSLEKIVGGG
jgi:hypothetical protein